MSIRDLIKPLVPKSLRDRTYLFRENVTRFGLVKGSRAFYKDKTNLFRQYVRRFGLVKGSRIFYKVSRRTNEIVSIVIPSSRFPIHLRGGTSDRETFEQIEIERQYDLLRDLNPAGIVDAGANAGFSTLFFANLFPQAHVIAIEPEPSNVELLRRNVAGYPNVTVLPTALFGRNTKVAIQNPNDAKWAFRVGETLSGHEIETLTMEDVFHLGGFKEIDVLKLDVEGAEKDIFDHSATWIDRVNIIMVELHDRFVPGCTKSLLDAVKHSHPCMARSGEHIILAKDASRKNVVWERCQEFRPGELT